MFRGFVYPLFFSSLSVRTLQISCEVLDVIHNRHCVVIIAPVFFSGSYVTVRVVDKRTMLSRKCLHVTMNLNILFLQMITSLKATLTIKKNIINLRLNRLSIKLTFVLLFYIHIKGRIDHKHRKSPFFCSGEAIL